MDDVGNQHELLRTPSIEDRPVTRERTGQAGLVSRMRRLFSGSDRAMGVDTPEQIELLVQKLGEKGRYKELQRRCKEEGLPANLKTDKLMDALRAHLLGKLRQAVPPGTPAVPHKIPAPEIIDEGASSQQRSAAKAMDASGKSASSARTLFPTLQYQLPLSHGQGVEASAGTPCIKGHPIAEPSSPLSPIVHEDFITFVSFNCSNPKKFGRVLKEEGVRAVCGIIKERSPDIIFMQEFESALRDNDKCKRILVELGYDVLQASSVDVQKTARATYDTAVAFRRDQFEVIRQDQALPAETWKLANKSDRSSRHKAPSAVNPSDEDLMGRYTAVMLRPRNIPTTSESKLLAVSFHGHYRKEKSHKVDLAKRLRRLLEVEAETESANIVCGGDWNIPVTLHMDGFSGQESIQFGGTEYRKGSFRVPKPGEKLNKQREREFDYFYISRNRNASFTLESVSEQVFGVPDDLQPSCGEDFDHHPIELKMAVRLKHHS